MFLILKKDNSESVNSIIEKESAVCFYYWNNCGHCHQIMPTWIKLCKKHNKDVNIINIELSEMQYLNSESRNIMGFPSILRYEKGIKKEEFNGQRDSDSLEKFLLKSKKAAPKKAVPKKPIIIKKKPIKKPIKKAVVKKPKK